MRQIFHIRDIDGDPITVICPVGGDEIWGSVCDIVAEHFHCDPDDVHSIEPTEDEPDELLAIDDTPVARLVMEWLR